MRRRPTVYPFDIFTNRIYLREYIRIFAIILFVLEACNANEPQLQPATVTGVQTHRAAATDADSARDAGVGVAYTWSGKGCTRSACHGAIEPIREPSSTMFQRIAKKGARLGEPDGCTVCHGGTPSAPDAAGAHSGTVAAMAEAGGPDAFFADPASPWVNGRSCGQCHKEHVKAQWSSLMMTEAGKIQGTAWSFGGLEGYEHTWGNYDAKNPKGAHAQLGTDDYRAYMQVKRKLHPNVYPDSQKTVPPAPTQEDLEDLAQHPEMAAFTYMRAECQRCHLGVRGRFRRGDYRGMGCGACHVPYSNEGLYEGQDQALPRKEVGHPLTHQLQATRDAVVHVHGEEYSGIPVETCTTCHNRGKRIGVSYQGLMESAWGSPYTEGGGGQLDLHSKHYMALAPDVHAELGMLCQDCHTSLDVHGDGLLAGTNLAAVEIECSDCHGTPDAYPWELPLGYGDESGPGVAMGPGRGLSQTLPKMLRQGAKHDVEGGYLRTARGNPFPEVVRRGEQVVVHTAGGKDLILTPLKAMHDAEKFGVDAEVAMVHVDKHLETMECYSCHTQWAPQCYGCHVSIDYSVKGGSFDWVAAGHLHQTKEHRTDPSEQGYPVNIPGKVTEMRSFLRWEDPPLGVNGEGRVTPIIPGCQTSVTVIAPNGDTVLKNHVFRGPAHSEGAGEEGQAGSDMSPVQPHTVGKSRSCESCHTSRKAAGYGIGGGTTQRTLNTAKVVDLMTAGGKVLPKAARAQIEAVKGMRDWSAMIDANGKQLQTVGHHFSGSGPLSEVQRATLAREGTCVGCHQEIPDASLAVNALHHAAAQIDGIPKTAAQHNRLLDKVVLAAAWVQVAGGIAVGALVTLFLVLWRRRRHGP